MAHSEKLFAQAKKWIPGGVNSPVRAFQAVGGVPKFIDHAQGAYLYDVEGMAYLDYLGSWGPMIIGHAHPQVVGAVTKAVQQGLSFGAVTEAETTMAQLICELVPSVEMVRMVNSGTEAVMSAIRLARGYTGKNKIIKFEGCYHGHSDAMLVKAGSGVMTAGIPDSLGVAPGCAQDTLSAIFNDLESIDRLLEQHRGDIAAVILELVPANMGVVLPQEGFLLGLQRRCQEQGILLIADEVITGFRLGLGGAQELFGLTPDLTTFGKIIGGGMPVGAYGGRRDIMKMIAPSGGVYQAGTLSGNPIAMAAGITQLTILKENPEIFFHLKGLGQRLQQGLTEIIARQKVAAVVNGIGSLSCLFFTENPVSNYTEAKQSNTEQYRRFFHEMLDNGFYFAPSQFEAAFLSAVHTEAEIDRTLEYAEKALEKIKNA